jgi:NAD(P)-dependent dehydrogenase (short-subunit alcohol dehydrogenase family)
MGRWGRSYRADVTDTVAIDQAVSQIANEAPYPLTVLVNNAGITRDRSFMKMTAVEWQEVIATNLTGVFNATKAMLPHMLERGYGRIVNIGSIIGQTGAFGQANYAASKAGIIGMSKSLALEVIGKGITVNVVAPGWIDTAMLRQVPEERRAQLTSKIPAGQFGTPEHVADLVAWLCLPSSSYITGQTIGVNGGAY